MRQPDPGRRRSAQAADGAASVWVAASAGTGKTKVLTDRVLALMLRGSDPARILCLTFTRAAAAEMANRLNERLSQWAVAGDGAAGAGSSGAARAHARRRAFGAGRAASSPACSMRPAA